MVSNALKQLLNDTDWGELDYLVIDTRPAPVMYTDPAAVVRDHWCRGGDYAADHRTG